MDDDFKFSNEFEEKYPFLLNLFELIKDRCKLKGITIKNIQNLNWCERYLFEREFENVAIDFGYNSQGFIGRVTPLNKTCNSPALLNELSLIIRNLSL